MQPQLHWQRRQSWSSRRTNLKDIRKRRCGLVFPCNRKNLSLILIPRSLIWMMNLSLAILKQIRSSSRRLMYIPLRTELTSKKLPNEIKKEESSDSSSTSSSSDSDSDSDDKKEGTSDSESSSSSSSDDDESEVSLR